MPKLDNYRVPVKGPVHLADYDPAATPFAHGTVKAQEKDLKTLNKQLAQLMRPLQGENKRSVLLVLQGTDTSGKDGTVRGVFKTTGPQGLRMATFKSPSKEELSHDYLWRCHAVVPAKGEIGIWNRSHYEDVLVPLVNGWITPQVAKQRYAQINDFERLLAENGTTVLKCMLHISKDEQRVRLQERIEVPEKRWKFSLDDLAVRKQWDAYQQAYEDLLEATSTAHAPWYVVPADNKLHRNLMVNTLLNHCLLDMQPQYPVDFPELVGLQVE
ncbi:PPK2 family polyphosphate kinase [Comamonas sediminis]|uniref:PPK2 family polyphosphate kinase n=1 Tax=Comamonas sediminis TaxID=1783360 RepID=UPI003D2DFBD7